MATSTDKTHLYWATGCTSCLRIKEFLERNDVSFVSHNVVKSKETDVDDTDSEGISSEVGIKGVDEALMQEMADHGLPQHVPIVRQGAAWADGKDLAAVADLVGVDHDADPLAPEELNRRLMMLLDTTLSYLERLPPEQLTTDIPNRPRSYGELVQHIFSLPDVFLMHEAGVPMTGVPRMEHSWDPHSVVALAAYGESVRGRLTDWMTTAGQECDWMEPADVFWGQPTKHELFERTTWHTGQHVRQLEWILTNTLEQSIEEPLDPALWEGLPMPEKVWNTK